MLTSHWRDLYQEETEHKERLRSATALPLGLLTLVGGGIGAMLKEFRNGPSWSSIFWLLVAIALIAATVAMYRLIRAMHGYSYKAMPSAEEQRQYKSELAEWHKEHGSADGADKDFSQWLDDNYSKAAEANYYQNARKSENLYLANRAAIWCVVATLLAFIPFLLRSRQAESPIHRVKIMSNPDTTTKSPAPAPVPPPPKPPAPPLKDLREGFIPTPIIPPQVPTNR